MSTQELNKFIENALFEDIRDGDHTSLACIDSNSINEANLIIKDDGIIAGIELARSIFNFVDQEIEFFKLKNDGDQVKYGEIAYKVKEVLGQY